MRQAPAPTLLHYRRRPRAIIRLTRQAHHHHRLRLPGPLTLSPSACRPGRASAAALHGGQGTLSGINLQTTWGESCSAAKSQGGPGAVVPVVQRRPAGGRGGSGLGESSLHCCTALRTKNLPMTAG